MFSNHTVKKNSLCLTCSYSTSNVSSRKKGIKKRLKKGVTLAKNAAPVLDEKATEYYISKEINE